MSDVATYAEPATLPRLSRQLEDVLAAMHEGRHGHVTPMDAQEARRALPAFEAVMAQPVTRQAITDWMAGIAAAASNPPTSADFKARVAMVCDVSSDLPLCVWTPDTRRSFIRTQAWWPGAGEVDKFLRGYLNGLINKRVHLRSLARQQDDHATAHAEAAPVATAEQRQAIAAKFKREFAQAMEPIRQTAAAPAATRVEPRPISEGHLAILRNDNPLVQAALRMQREIAAQEGAQ